MSVQYTLTFMILWPAVVFCCMLIAYFYPTNNELSFFLHPLGLIQLSWKLPDS